MGLHPLPVSYLVSGKPASGSRGFMVGLTETSKRTYLKGDLPGLLLPVPQSLWWAPADPLLHRRASNNSKYFWFSLLWGHCSFPLDLSACKILCPPRVVYYLQSCISLIIKCRWYSRLDSLAGKPDMGFRTFTTGKNYFGIIVASLWVTHPVSMWFYFIVIVPLLPSCCGFFVFGCRVSFFGGF